MKIQERVKAIDGLVDSMDMNNDKLGTNIMQYEKDIEYLEQKMPEDHPLHKLQELLDKWSQEKIRTDDEMA